jgi:benzodiazapine receptor
MEEERPADIVYYLFMRTKPNYIIIPLATVATAGIGSIITSAGMNWYNGISKPSFTPPGSFIGTVWTILFVLSTIAALIVWNKAENRKNIIGAAFIINALLNIGWTGLFFGLHLIGPAITEAGLLGLSVLTLIILAWPVSRFAAWLLAPYLAWVSFATYLTYSIWVVNK